MIRLPTKFGVMAPSRPRASGDDPARMEDVNSLLR